MKRNSIKTGTKLTSSGTNEQCAQVKQLVQYIVSKGLENATNGCGRSKDGIFESPQIALAVMRHLDRQLGLSLPDALSAVAIEIVHVIYDLALVAEMASGAKEAPGRTEERLDQQEQFDFALARVARDVDVLQQVRATTSKNCDLLCGALHGLVGDGSEAARLIARFTTLFPDRDPSGATIPESWPDQFAWDAYLRIACLDQMVEKYPDYLTHSAQQMNAWPMLRYLHTDTRGRFELIADKLKLGAQHPLKVDKTARYRPGTPMVGYLDGIIWKLHVFRLWHPEHGKENTTAIGETWKRLGSVHEKPADPSMLEILKTTLNIPRLTKGTAEEWAKKVIVPFIMATDAKTAETCDEPALLKIWRQRRNREMPILKSRSDFKSRLQPAVVKTLRSMAKDAHDASCDL